MSIENNKLTVVGFGVFMLGVSLYAVVQLVSGINFLSFATVAVLFLPFLFAGFLSLKPYWVSFTLGCIPLVGGGLVSIPLFDRLSPVMLMIVIVFGLSLGHKILKGDRSPLFDTPEARAMLFVGVVITGWFIYQRPSSFRLGSSTGGLKSALHFLLFIFGFWGMSYVVKNEFEVKRGLRSLLVIACCVWIVPLIGHLESIRGTMFLFERGSWMLFPLLLALMFHREVIGKNRSILPRFLVIFTFMPMAVFSAFRSRLLFFLATLAAVSFLYRKMKHTFVRSVVVLVILLAGLIAVRGEVPARLIRPLSLFIPGLHLSSEDASRMGISSATGWEDEFRAQLLRMTWIKVKEHPIFGGGSELDLQKAVSAYLLADRAVSQKELLVMGGGTHNLLFALMMSYGIPATIAFMYGYAVFYIKFIKGTLRLENSEQKVFCAAIIGLVVSSTGQALMNGGAVDMMVLCIPFGIMNGLMHRPEWPHAPKRGNPVAATPARSRALAMSAG